MTKTTSNNTRTNSRVVDGVVATLGLGVAVAGFMSDRIGWWMVGA